MKSQKSPLQLIIGEKEEERKIGLVYRRAA
jgi:hypothetical protein